ncbi:hypothetical protein ACFFRR_008135 [Megaselia abdita]
MKTLLIAITLLGVMSTLSSASTWLHFNRITRNLPFYPKLDDDIGYQNNMYGPVDNALDEDEPCYGRKCSSSAYCCPGSICVAIDGDSGNCFYLYGRKIGDLCHRNNDCETGLECAKGPTGNYVCQAIITPITSVYKQFGDNCNTSTECDVNGGLCCQLLRRHHHRFPKKVCSYYRDPLMCIDVIEEEADKKKH